MLRLSQIATVLALIAFGGCRDDAPRKANETGGRPPSPARPLGADWYEDPDRDGIPTHTELRIGTDPRSDRCIKDLGCPGVEEAAPTGLRDEKPSNTLLMLDSSGSMRGPAGAGVQKITAAKDALERFVVGTPDSTELGLLVYGHKGSGATGDKLESCRGAELLARLGEIDYRNASEVLARFKPRGYTPIARALREAERAFAGQEGARNRVVLVSDGVETCGRDPLAAARRLKGAGIAVTVDVVGFDIAKSTDAARLKQIAEMTGGTYTGARSGSELTDYLNREGERLMAENRALGCILRKGNVLSACQLMRQNVASADMLREENAVTVDLQGRENGLSAKLIGEENAARADGDLRLADEIAARLRRMIRQLSARRTRITREIARLRSVMEDKLESKRVRDDMTTRRKLVSIEAESAAVERRLKERYGQP